MERQLTIEEMKSLGIIFIGFGEDKKEENKEMNCEHLQTRFLDCDECENCEVQICVNCGEDITENDSIV